MNKSISELGPCEDSSSDFLFNCNCLDVVLRGIMKVIKTIKK